MDVDRPLHLEIITFGRDFNKSLVDVKWPEMLATLRFGEDFNQPLAGIHWPPAVKHLHFGRGFDRSLKGHVLPAGLETLVLGDNFDQDLRFAALPQSLHRLELGLNFCLLRHPLLWPPYLEDLRSKANFPLGERQQQVMLPATLRYLQFGDRFPTLACAAWLCCPRPLTNACVSGKKRCRAAGYMHQQERNRLFHLQFPGIIHHGFHCSMDSSGHRNLGKHVDHFSLNSLNSKKHFLNMLLVLQRM